MASGKSLVPAEIKAHRFLELDSLRGLAAASVILYHFTCIWIGSTFVHDLRISPAHILIAGHEAVVFFFLLSGFVLSVPFSGKRPPLYPAYLVQRFCRIYVPYAAAILLALMLDAGVHSSMRTGNYWVDQTWSLKPTGHMLRSLLLTESLYGTQANTAIWSVILEMRISLIFPFLYFAIRKLPWLVVVVLFLLLPPLAAGLGVSTPHFYSPFFTAGLFSFGVLLYLHLDEIAEHYKRLSRSGRLWFLCLSGLLFYGPLMLVEALSRSPGVVASGLTDDVIALGASGIIVVAVSSASIRSALHNRVLIRSGALSYSTYLMHGTVLFWIIRYFGGKVNLLYLFPVFLVLTYLVSEAFHFLVDSRAVILGRNCGRYVRELFQTYGSSTAVVRVAE